MPRRVFGKPRTAGMGGKGQTEPLVGAPHNRSDRTKPALVTCASPGFRNNRLRAAQLAGKILHTNAKTLFPLDWSPTVLKRKGFFRCQKLSANCDMGLCPLNPSKTEASF